jgi:hypothetical protein
MRILIVSAAAALGLSAVSAFAQTPGDPPTPPQAPAEITKNNPPPPPGPPGPRGPDGKDQARLGSGPGHPPPPPPRDRAGAIHIRDGRTEIDIRCAAGEPMKACSDTALQILDRLKRADGDGRRYQDRNDRSQRYDRNLYDGDDQ